MGQVGLSNMCFWHFFASFSAFDHFLHSSSIFLHFLACLAFSNISCSSSLLRLARTNNDSSEHFETLKPKCRWMDGTDIFDHIDYQITFILLNMYFISYFLIKGCYHYGAGVNTDKREDRQKEKENIRGEERKLFLLHPL